MSVTKLMHVYDVKLPTSDATGIRRAKIIQTYSYLCKYLKHYFIITHKYNS